MFSLTQTHKTILLFTAGIMASMNGLFILLHSNGLGFDRFAKFSFISEPQDSLATPALRSRVTFSRERNTQNTLLEHAQMERHTVTLDLDRLARFGS